MDAVPNSRYNGAVELTLGGGMAHKSWIRGALGLAVLMVTAAATPASAQPLGTFRWQTQPWCNVISVAVTQTGGAYRLEGTDDGCEITPRASVIGMAFANLDGSIGGGLTVIAGPGGIVLHIDVTIVPAAGFSGSWRDSAGRNGPFLFAPASVEGPVRPHILPSTPFGVVLVQPPGGGDRALSATVAIDTGTPNDAAAIYGRYGVPLPPGLEGPAGVRGESAASAGVFGRSDSAIGVVGGANGGIGVQGHAVAAAGIGVQAHHVNGGTALEINNGSVKVSGTVRSAFSVPIPTGSCDTISHPLLNGDPTALVFVTPQESHNYGSAEYFNGSWLICMDGPGSGPRPVAVLVIKQ